MTARYVVGIDGTTNCALAALDTLAEHPQVEHLPITQLAGPGPHPVAVDAPDASNP